MTVSCSKERERIKLLFVYSTLSSFILRDLEIFKRYFDVKEMKAKTFLVPRIGRDPLIFIKLMKGILWADVVFSWFADLNGFFIVLFCTFLGKKSILVTGGYDVANVPEVNYGDLRTLVGRFRVKFVLKCATKVLAVSESNKKEILKCANPMDLELVYNGIPVEKFKPSDEKEDLVVTVGPLTAERIKVKGLDAFVKASAYLPDVRFVLIGKYEDQLVNCLRKHSSSNLAFTGWLPIERVLRYYQRAKVYCQLSIHESFGVALAEAMACCCVPVVTRKYAIPEVVGDTGFYVPYDNPEATAETIRKALASNKGIKARERIRKYFSLKDREKKLVEEILKLYGKV